MTLEHNPSMAISERAILAIAIVNGFQRDGYGWPSYDVHDASAFLEMEEKIWLFPDGYKGLTWTVRFRTINQMRLFQLKYSEYL